MSKKTLVVRVLVGAVAVVALGWFAYGNLDQAADLRLGLFTLRSVPLPVVVFGALVIGMLAMLAFGLRTDLRTRQALERYDKIAGELRDAVAAEEPAAKREEQETSST